MVGGCELLGWFCEGVVLAADSLQFAFGLVVYEGGTLEA
jgi:hypothetical protein